MGTETIGSIVTPSTRAALYALKPTVGIQDSTGLYCMTEFFDSPGPMAKSAADVRVLTEILLGRKFNLPAESESNIWEGIEVGFLDPKVWKMADDFCTQFEGTAEQMVCLHIMTMCIANKLTFLFRSMSTRRQYLIYEAMAAH